MIEQGNLMNEIHAVLINFAPDLVEGWNNLEERIEALETALRLYTDAVEDITELTGETVTIGVSGVDPLVVDVIAAAQGERGCTGQQAK